MRSTFIACSWGPVFVASLALILSMPCTVWAPPSSTAEGFVAGTPVATPKGYKPIQRFSVGDPVLSYNIETGEVEEDVVSRVQRTKLDSFVVITLGKTVLAVAQDHRLYCPVERKEDEPVEVEEDDEWVMARDITSQHRIATIPPETIEVDDVGVVERGATAYSLTVRKNHNFFFSEQGILVHNIGSVLLGPVARTGLQILAAMGATEVAVRVNEIGEKGGVEAVEIPGLPKLSPYRPLESHVTEQPAQPPANASRATITTGASLLRYALNMVVEEEVLVISAPEESGALSASNKAEAAPPRRSERIAAQQAATQPSPAQAPAQKATTEEVVPIQPPALPKVHVREEVSPLQRDYPPPYTPASSMPNMMIGINGQRQTVMSSNSGFRMGVDIRTEGQSDRERDARIVHRANRLRLEAAYITSNPAAQQADFWIKRAREKAEEDGYGAPDAEFYLNNVEDLRFEEYRNFLRASIPDYDERMIDLKKALSQESGKSLVRKIPRGKYLDDRYCPYRGYDFYHNGKRVTPSQLIDILGNESLQRRLPIMEGAANISTSWAGNKIVKVDSLDPKDDEVAGAAIQHIATSSAQTTEGLISRLNASSTPEEVHAVLLSTYDRSSGQSYAQTVLQQLELYKYDGFIEYARTIEGYDQFMIELDANLGRGGNRALQKRVHEISKTLPKVGGFENKREHNWAWGLIGSHKDQWALRELIKQQADEARARQRAAAQQKAEARRIAAEKAAKESEAKRIAGEKLLAQQQESAVRRAAEQKAADEAHAARLAEETAASVEFAVPQQGASGEVPFPLQGLLDDAKRTLEFKEASKQISFLEGFANPTLRDMPYSEVRQAGLAGVSSAELLRTGMVTAAAGKQFGAVGGALVNHAINNPTLVGMAVSAAPEAVALTGKAVGAVARATATAATNAAGWVRLKLAQGYVWDGEGWYKPSWSSYQPLFGDDPMINPGGLSSVGLGLGKLKPPASGQRSQAKKAKEKAPRVATPKASRAEAAVAGTRSTAAAAEPRAKTRSAKTSPARKTRSATAVADAAPSSAAEVSTATGALEAVEERHYRTRSQARKEQRQASTKATDEAGSPQDPEDPEESDSDSDEEEEPPSKKPRGEEEKPKEPRLSAAEFEKRISKMSPGERVAAVKEMAKRVAKERGLGTKTNDKSVKNLSKKNPNRDIYRKADRKDKTEELYSTDTQHGRFEVCDKHGKHLREVDFDFKQTKGPDLSGKHDLIV